MVDLLGKLVSCRRRVTGRGRLSNEDLRPLTEREIGKSDPNYYRRTTMTEVLCRDGEQKDVRREGKLLSEK